MNNPENNITGDKTVGGKLDKKPTLLILENNPTSRDELIKLYRQYGYKVAGLKLLGNKSEGGLIERNADGSLQGHDANSETPIYGMFNDEAQRIVDLNPDAMLANTRSWFLGENYGFNFDHLNALKRLPCVGYQPQSEDPNIFGWQDHALGHIDRCIKDLLSQSLSLPNH